MSREGKIGFVHGYFSDKVATGWQVDPLSERTAEAAAKLLSQGKVDMLITSGAQINALEPSLGEVLAERICSELPKPLQRSVRVSPQAKLANTLGEARAFYAVSKHAPLYKVIFIGREVHGLRIKRAARRVWRSENVEFVSAESVISSEDMPYSNKELEILVAFRRQEKVLNPIDAIPFASAVVLDGVTRLLPQKGRMQQLVLQACDRICKVLN